MKKTVGITAGVVVLAAAGWVGATWHTGTRIEAEAPTRLAQLNKELAAALNSTGIGATVEQLSYERSLFSSKARYGVKLTTVPGGEEAPAEMVEFQANIEHGPFAAGALARGHWMPKLAFIHTELVSNELTKPVFEVTKGVSPVTSDIVVAYNGDSAGTANLAPFDFEKDKQSVKFSGMLIDGSFERATRKIVGTVKSDLLSMNITDTDENAKIDIQGIFMDVDSYAGKTGMDIGTSSLKIDSVSADIQPLQEGESGQTEVIPGAGTKVVIKDQLYAAKIREEGTNLNYQTDYKIGQVLVNGADYGKGNATLTFANIDSQSAQALVDLYNQVLTDMEVDRSQNEPSSARLIEAANQLNKLLAANPTMRLDPFIWETAKGQSNLTLAVDLTKPTGLTPDFKAEDYEKLLQESIKLIDLKVSVSKPMVQGLVAQYLESSGSDAATANEEAAEQVDSLGGLAEMFGIAKVEADKLVGTFHYADNKALLNGEEIPAEELFGNLLSGLGSDDYDDEDTSDTVLSGLDTSVLSDILDYAGYDYEIDMTSGSPVINVDASVEGAKSFEISFNECEESINCSDVMMQVNVETPHAVPMHVLNTWNRENRLTRVYWNSDRDTAVMEMDINAYGGIGQSNVEYQVNSFISQLPMFIETMQSAPKK